MHAQTAAALSHADECVQEVRLLCDECCELVDDHHQARQQYVGNGGAQRCEIGSAVVAQDSFPSAQLRVQAAQGTVGEVVVEVGDHADHVRQRSAGIEGGAALVVDQHEAEVRRAGAGSHACDQAA